MDSVPEPLPMPARRGDLLITGAMTVFPDGTRLADLRVEAGVITEVAVGGGLEPKGGEEVHLNGEGLHLIPGVIDPQVHFREPGQPEKEDLASGSCAGVSGGVTAFLDMPNNHPAATTVPSIEAKIASAGATAVSHHGFFIGATPDNLEDLQEAVGKPGEPIARPGICGIKIFMGSSTGSLLVSEEGALDRIFEGTAGLIAVHAEDEDRLISRKGIRGTHRHGRPRRVARRRDGAARDPTGRWLSDHTQPPPARAPSDLGHRSRLAGRPHIASWRGGRRPVHHGRNPATAPDLRRNGRGAARHAPEDESAHPLRQGPRDPVVPAQRRHNHVHGHRSRAPHLGGQGAWIPEGALACRAWKPPSR